MSKIIETGKGIGIKIEEYNGIYSLTAQREYNGKWYGQWCRLIFGRDENGEDKLSEKSTPVKVTLGNKKQALDALSQLLDSFCDDKKGNEDIPF